jgi:hypothetical protein
VHRILTALSILSISGVASGCNAFLNIEESARVLPDSGPDSGHEACDDTTSNGDAGDCWCCDPQCPSPVCQQSTCLLLRPYPASAVAATGFGPIFPVFGLDDTGIAELAGVQIHVTAPGVLVHLGMLTAFGGFQGYLGIYTDEGGRPGTRIASTAEFEVAGDTVFSNPQPTVVEVIHPTALAAGYYWILGIWRSELWFETSSGTQPACNDGCVEWYELPVPYGLPDTAVPEQTMQLHPTPVLYAEVAQ